MQHHLFSASAPMFDPALARIERQVLDATAWVDYLPNWLDGADVVFDGLIQSTEWRHQQRRMYERVVDVPRLVGTPAPNSEYGPLLTAMADSLSARYSQSLTSISLALYRDGSDSVAPHGDKIGRRLPNPVIAIVSVGAPRRFTLKPKGGGAGHRFSLGWGDLLVMGGSCQRTWLHGVPKVSAALPRISIMFRPDPDLH
ncbi:MAG: alpha-ketoglutarate-dependent dioxygenase AlkB [Pseudomonadota bacterium]